MILNQDLSRDGHAAAGHCVLPNEIWTTFEAIPVLLTPTGPSAFTVETDDVLRSRQERSFFDWGIGILEDAGLAGVLKNDYVYQSTTLKGEIHPETGTPYSLSLSRTSVEFDYGLGTGGPIQFTDAMVETDGPEIEAAQIRRTLELARRQSVLLRAWKNCTSLRSSHAVIYRDLRPVFHDSELAMDVSMDLAEFTVAIRRTSEVGVFRYSLTDVETPMMHSPRVVDALLSDAAEEAGGVPEPVTILGAMVRAAEAARRDPEWLGASNGR